MLAHQIPFGPLLRRWRERRRMTQADLALAAESSTRHLSCLETGKAQPSREMIARLAELLDVPLRDLNSLLLAAGFAPAFRESAIDGLYVAVISARSCSRSDGKLRDERTVASAPARPSSAPTLPRQHLAAAANAPQARRK